MQILCGTDFSPNATEAAAAAAALARMFGDRLLLVHAGVPPADDGLGPETGTATSATLRAQLQTQVSALAGIGIPVEARLASGRPADALQRLAPPDRTRMIVLSSIGQVALA
ncbi:MAG: universal stress protein, partial [Verrucomicrobia bacterium]|nr:universal stress protein [Verrucomicrobiota bacterium]